MYGGSIRYTNGAWDILASGLKQDGANNNGSAKAVMAGGSYDAKFAKIFVGYTREKNDCVSCTGVLARIEGITPRGAGDFTLMNIGVRVPFGALTAIAEALKVQDRSDYAAPTQSRSAPWFAVGAEYALSNRTKLWGSVGTISNKNGSQYVLQTGGALRPVGLVDGTNATARNFGVGMTHMF
jgi:predicted porin